MGYIIGKNRRVDSRHLLKAKPGVLQDQCFRFFFYCTVCVEEKRYVSFMGKRI